MMHGSMHRLGGGGDFWIGREIAKWMGLKLLMLKCIFWVCRPSSFYMLNWFCMSSRLIVSIWAGVEIFSASFNLRYIWWKRTNDFLKSRLVKAYLFGFDTIYLDLYEVPYTMVKPRPWISNILMIVKSWRLCFEQSVGYLQRDPWKMHLRSFQYCCFSNLGNEEAITTVETD